MAEALRVEIVSGETIKPSSPTPQSQRIYHLSILDQLAPSLYVPLVLFYSNPTPSDRLKKSLSTMLTHMYPLAGRIKDTFSIECNDEGADFIEARVTQDMSAVLKHPKIHLLQQLLPCNPQKWAANPGAEVILAIQVNHFGCGGMALAVCISHVIADASTLGAFLKNWATVARDGDIKAVDGGDFILDCSWLLPAPQHGAGFNLAPLCEEPDKLVKKSVFKRFLFDKSKIVALREKSSGGSTRMEALMALFWHALISKNMVKKIFLLQILVELRKRMNPPLSPNSVGNIFHMAVAQWTATEMSSNYKELVKRVGDAIKTVNNDNVRKLHENGEYLDTLKYMVTNTINRDDVGTLLCSSWCRFPFYESDFGWGKPSWVGIGLELSNVVVFIDGSDGEGIEAWVALSPEDMDKLDQNLDFLAYVSSSQTL